MNTRALGAVSVKFLVPLSGTKLLTVEYCLKNLTKHFYCFASFSCSFFSLFNCNGSVGKSAWRNFS